MGNTRTWTREFNTTTSKLGLFVKSKAGRSEKARRAAMARAKDGRDPSLPEKAREAVRLRMVKHDLQRIAGTV